MRKHWIGYAVWLILAGCLYFFENNTGTRVILLCSLLVPLFPSLRSDCFDREAQGNGIMPPRTAGTFIRGEAFGNGTALPRTTRTIIRGKEDGTGDIRPYRPGDPVRRIHWKLSAKKGELLIRETQAAEETAQEEYRETRIAEEAAAEELRETQTAEKTAEGKRVRFRRILIRGLIIVILLCSALLLLVPKARNRCMALGNRLFTASETVNAYAYDRFPVPEGQGEVFADTLLTIAAGAVAALAVTLRSRALILGLISLLTLGQIYFGLCLPAWILIPGYTLAGVLLMRHPTAGSLKRLAVLVLGVTVCCAILFPGVDAATESASETVRDRLSQMAQQLIGIPAETPEGETETRHTHTQTLFTGAREVSAGREYRLVTVGEEQISRPKWIDYVRIILLLLLAVGVVTLPFVPFLLLNARKKKAAEVRKAFLSADVSMAVRAIFQQVITWLEATGSGGGNRLYREWTGELPEGLPEGYAERFSACVADFEEALYSSHELPEEKREQALDLLRETEKALWEKAGWKLRFRLKYRMCLCE